MIRCLDIGLKSFAETIELQKKLQQEKVLGTVPDTLIFCEHFPVFTIGKKDCSSDWLTSFNSIAEDGIEIIKTNRGGRITYHGPGQLIGYLIFDIRRIGVKGFVHMVEAACLKTLKDFGIAASLDKDYPGIWAEDKKIVAIGFHISKNVSMHGFALNVCPNLTHYRHIVPCGISSRGVTSMKELLGDETPCMDDIKAKLFSYLVAGSTEENVRLLSSLNTLKGSECLASSGRDLQNSS